MELTLPEDKTDRINFILSLIIRLSIVIALVIEILVGRWTPFFASILAFFLTFLPAIIENNYKISLPSEFEILIIIFIYASIFLGEVRGYYTRFWWWDAILHWTSGMILGLIGFIILFVLFKNDLIHTRPII